MAWIEKDEYKSAPWRDIRVERPCEHDGYNVCICTGPLVGGEYRMVYKRSRFGKAYDYFYDEWGRQWGWDFIRYWKHPGE